MPETAVVNVSRGLQASRRRRELASDARAGSWARGRARTTQRQFLRELWWQFGAFILLVVGIAIGVGQTLRSDFLSGLVLGAAAVGAPMLVWVFVMQFTGTAQIMMGDQAEQWTAQELRRFQRQGWRLINHFALRADDIDHVLIGPAGAWAVETKWSATDWRSQTGRASIERAVAQIERNARSLRLWHDFKSRAIPVNAVVVLWGGGSGKWPADAQVTSVQGVPVVTGRALNGWFGERAAAAPLLLGPDQVDAAWTAMDRQVAERDPLDLESNPLPRSFAEWASLSAWAVTAFALAVLTFGRLMDVASNQPSAVAGALVAAAPGALAQRVSSSAGVVWAARTWTATLVLLGVVLAAAVGLERLG